MVRMKLGPVWRRVVRALGCAALACGLAFLPGCGFVTVPNADDSSAATHKGEFSPRRFAHPIGNKPDRSKDAKPRAQQTTSPPPVRLKPLEQPKEPFKTPPMPDPPGEKTQELDRIAYGLKKVVWESAGVVDPKTTKARCTVGENDIIKVATYKFRCDVSLWASSSRFYIRAKVSRTKVVWTWSARKLPVSEEKAVYEATRQSFKPARVTCDIIRLELVEVGNRHGFTCWVTDVYNESTTYHGELLPDGMLAFRPAPN